MNLEWDNNKKTLSGESAVVKEDPYQIAVYLPEGFTFSGMECAGLEGEIKKHDNHLTAIVIPGKTGTIRWSMTCVHSQERGEEP